MDRQTGGPHLVSAKVTTRMNLADASLRVLCDRTGHPPATTSIDDIGFKDR
jgi:hypothetical protein